MKNEYTEAQIRELTGRELRVAVSLLVLGDDLTANTDERIGLAVCEYYGWTDLSLSIGMYQWKNRDKLDSASRGRLEQHVANWRAEPLEMPLNWCEGLFAEGMPLGPEKRYAVGPISNGEFRVWELTELLNPSKEFDPFPLSPDMRTAILRVSCIVKLREGE